MIILVIGTTGKLEVGGQGLTLRWHSMTNDSAVPISMPLKEVFDIINSVVVSLDG